MKKICFSLMVLFSLQVASQKATFSIPLAEQLTNSKGKSKVSKLIKAKDWDFLFPNRVGKGSKKNSTNDFYSYHAFIKAANLFNGFLSEGDVVTQKRELAAFLANIAQETSGGWDEAPGGYFKWGLFFIEEQNPNGLMDYNDVSKIKYPAVADKKYFGRGPKQMSWNYNYGQFSEAWYGTKDTLLAHPEYVAQDSVLSFASAIWFWMTPQFPKPSCHDIMVNKWIPTENDFSKGRIPGFGATVNVINGGVECGMGSDLPKTKYRYQYYLFFCRYFNVLPGENMSCTNQKPFGQ